MKEGNNLMRWLVLAVGVVLVAACGSSIGQGGPSPSSSPTPEANFTAAALASIVLSDKQTAVWQTATRPDLTGPFTATSNTNPNELPKPPSNLQAGYRQTVGNPGVTGLNTVRTILELYKMPTEAQAAVSPTVQAYEAIGYSSVVDPTAAGLESGDFARLGTNVPVAPQFAQGTATKGVVFVWRKGNLLLIQIDGGDSTWTTTAAKQWVTDVDSNAQAAAS
jgi:hypothetical protein